MTVDRRGFLASLAGWVAAGPLCAGEARTAKYDVRQVAVACGLPKPFRVLHLSDSHLVALSAKERENPLREKLARERLATHQGREAAQGLADMAAYAKAHGLPIVHTGDLIDFLGEAELAAAARFVSDTGAFVAAGNHEWCYHMYTKKESPHYLRELFLARLCEVYQNDLDCSAKVMGGVNFVQFDNWNYQIGEKQNAFIRQELGRGLPTALMCHCPILEMLEPVPKQAWRKPTACTRDALAYLQSCENLRVALCGHRHKFAEARFSPTAMQYIVSATSARAGYEVTFN